MTKNSTIPSTGLNHASARKQRIESWASKRQNSINRGIATAASTLLGTAAAQKRSESSFTQANRMLNVHLLQLSEERQKIIEQRTFDQKLFANKQAIKHKDNQVVLDTLSYVRKCCRYVDTNDYKIEYPDPLAHPTRKSKTKRGLSRSSSVSAKSSSSKRSLSASTNNQINTSLTEISPELDDLSSANPKPVENEITDNMATPTMPNETLVDDDAQKRHVQFQIHSDNTILINETTPLMNKSNSYNENKHMKRNITSAPTVRTSNSSYDMRSTNSAPSCKTELSIIGYSKEKINQSLKSKRFIPQINSTKPSVQEFRLHPEKFLSASNCYLPLLRRHAIENETKEYLTKQQKEKNNNNLTKKQQIHFSPSLSRLSAESDVVFDDARSFLSDDNEIGKYTSHSQLSHSNEQERKNSKKRLPTKIDMMDTTSDDSLSHTIAMARLRDREYARLNELVHSNLIEKILEPLSTIKNDENEQINLKQEKTSNNNKQQLNTSSRARQLADILRSIDSLSCSDMTEKHHTRKDVDVEQNQAKLGILIF
ncbi:unnamed protein product [Adineta steineri]|uniref:Uncharacterized protein n=1 Tax=Adineta steineri TaxID=433720 RepID=A0A814T8H7_9BILA|nr:unnamed protein product [Adineta steineri]CAF3636394.1 unnamed protein product [Adineta steineri]